MKKAFVCSLLLAGLSASAAAQNQTGTSSNAAANKELAAECQQFFKDTNTLANGSLCYRDNKEAAEYFNFLSMALLFSHPKVDQCRQYLRLEKEFKKQSFYHLEDKELKRLCAESREERDRLRRQVEAYMDSKIKQYMDSMRKKKHRAEVFPLMNCCVKPLPKKPNAAPKPMPLSVRRMADKDGRGRLKIWKSGFQTASSCPGKTKGRPFGLSGKPPV